MSDELPARLGRYQILRRLGTGGMAEVFLAKTTGAEGIEKVLVVKRVLPSFARSAKFISMFVDEAKVAMRLNHPHVVQVYAFEQERREFLLAMEFVDGIDLGRLVAGARRTGGRLPYELAAKIVADVAKGLDYAHKRKDEAGEPLEIVHRDVSPQNVLITYDGVVKVADFGIAKAKLVSEETGVIKGKFAYMSPEQARGERVDRRSDVYSMGVLLAELLMNRAMYPGQHGLDVLDQVRDGKLTLPAEVDPDVPVELQAVVAKATARQREDRFESARALANALLKYLHGLENPVDTESLEAFLMDVTPRERTSYLAASERPSAVTVHQTALSGVGTGEIRERRRVVVIAGLFCEAGTGELIDDHTVDPGVVRVLDAIAYKNDAVLSWPDGQGRRRFHFLVGFGRTSVSDPLLATRLGMDVIEALAGLEEDLAEPLTAALGISRGVISSVRNAQHRLVRYAPVGSVLEVAERLAAGATGGEVLASGDIYRLVRRDFAFAEASREIDVRTGAGETLGIAAWRLRGALTQAERAELLGASDVLELHGRVEALGLIRELYAEVVSDERASFAAVVGDLGIGKSSMLRAALDGLDPEPRIIWVDCGYGAGDTPHAVVADVLRAGLDLPTQVDDETLQAALRTAGLDEELVLFAAATFKPLFSEVSEPLDEPGDRVALLQRAVAGVFMTLAKQRPLVLVIDSMQWADKASLELFVRISRKNYPVPVLALVSTRPDSRAENILRGVPRITLEELDQSAARAVVRDRFGADVPDDVHTLIEARAGGNPFFLVELVDAMIERDVVDIEGEGAHRRVIRRPGAQVQLPTTLEGVIAARLDELDDDERLALRWLSVAGTGLHRGELDKLGGREGLDDALERLLERELVLLRPDHAWTFASAVVRQVAYEATDLEDRARMHRKVAGHLRQPGRLSGPGRIARHLEQAGERASAAQAYLEAGERARGMYSNHDALRFLGRALQLLPGDDLAKRFRAHVGREQILRFLGRPREQLRELEAMRRLAAQGGSPRRRATALLRHARFDLDNGHKPATVSAMVRDAFDAAKATGDIGLELDAYQLRAEIEGLQGQPQAALRLCEEALDRAGYREDLLGQRADMLVQQGILLRRVGDVPQAISAYTEAIVIFRRLGVARTEASALNGLGVALATAGQYEDAIKVLLASIQIDRETGGRLRLGRKLSNVGQLYERLGQGELGREYVRKALDVFEVVDDRNGRTDALAALAEMTIESGGDPTGASLLLDQARRIAEVAGSHYDIARERIVRSHLERALGRFDAAAEAASAGLQAARTGGLKSYELHALVQLARALAALGDREALNVVADAWRRLEETRPERAERVQLEIARVFQGFDESDSAARAFEQAATTLQETAAGIRSERVRELFLSTPEAREILAGVGAGA